MPDLVPGIHVFTTDERRRGWPVTSPAMTVVKTSSIAGHDDSPHRHLDRTDRDPDVVAAVGPDGCDRENSGVSARRHDVRDRRCGRFHQLHLAARGLRRVEATAGRLGGRRRRAVRLSRAVFPGAALCAAGRSRPLELSLAAVDRAVLLAAAGRAAGGASHHRRAARSRRHGVAVVRQQRRRLCARPDPGTGGGLRRRLCLGGLFGDVAQAQGGADRCGGRLLPRDRAARGSGPWHGRDHGLAGNVRAVARHRRARRRPGRRRVLYLGHRHEARRHPRAGCGVLRDAAALDRVPDSRRLCQAERHDRDCRDPDRRRRPDRGEGYGVEAKP